MYDNHETSITWRSQILVHSEYVPQPNFSATSKHCDRKSMIFDAYAITTCDSQISFDDFLYFNLESKFWTFPYS